MNSTNSLPKTREEARATNALRFFTGKPCNNGHVAPRNTKSGKCLECSAAKGRRDRARNPEATTAAVMRWRSKNADRVKAYRDQYNAEYAEANREVLRQKGREYSAKNAETRRLKEKERRIRKADEIRAKDRARYKADPEGRKKHIKDWQIANPHKLAEFNAHRRAVQLQATPKWLTSEHRMEMAEIYSEAKRITKETGIIHHVDHIHPLQGENFCGLHVPWNLQVITATENLQKNNRLDLKVAAEQAMATAKRHGIEIDPRVAALKAA